MFYRKLWINLQVLVRECQSLSLETRDGTTDVNRIEQEMGNEEETET